MKGEYVGRRTEVGCAGGRWEGRAGREGREWGKKMEEGKTG